MGIRLHNHVFHFYDLSTSSNAFRGFFQRARVVTSKCGSAQAKKLKLSLFLDPFKIPRESLILHFYELSFTPNENYRFFAVRTY